MKHDTAVEIARAAPAVAGASAAWSLQDYSVLATLTAATATAIYVLIQAAFLVRKWYLMEKRVKVPDTGALPLGD